MYSDIQQAIAIDLTPLTGTPQKKTVSRLPKCIAFELTADSALSELRSFIDEHNLCVSKAIGGRSRRTKDDIVSDIEEAIDVLSRMEVDQEGADGGASYTLPTKESLRGEKLILNLADHQRVGLRTHLNYVISRLGGVSSLLSDAFHGSRMNSQPADFIIDDPSSRGLAHLLGAWRLAGSVDPSITQHQLRSYRLFSLSPPALPRVRVAGLTTRQLCVEMGKGVDGIVKEIQTHGTPEDVGETRDGLAAAASASAYAFTSPSASASA